MNTKEHGTKAIQASCGLQGVLLGVGMLLGVGATTCRGLELQLRQQEGAYWLEITGTPNTRVDITSSSRFDGDTWEKAGSIMMEQGVMRWPMTTGLPSLFYRGTEVILEVKPAADPARMVWCSAGTFRMGSDADETRPNMNWHMVSEVPATLVTLTHGFWIGAYEVTQREYMDIMGDNPSYFTNAANHMDLPSDRLTWMMASNYCAKLSQREFLAGRLPEGYTYRLPTEAEWEYACRAGTTSRFYFGEYTNYWSEPLKTPLGEHSWYFKNSKGSVREPGLKKPNQWGLYDMYGNICEWVIDRAAPYPGGHVTNYCANSWINMNGQSFTNAAPAPWSTMAIYRSGNWNDTDLRGQGSPARIAGWKTTYWQNLGLRVVLGPVLPGVWTYRGE